MEKLKLGIVLGCMVTMYNAPESASQTDSVCENQNASDAHFPTGSSSSQETAPDLECLAPEVAIRGCVLADQPFIKLKSAKYHTPDKGWQSCFENPEGERGSIDSFLGGSRVYFFDWRARPSASIYYLGPVKKVVIILETSNRKQFGDAMKKTSLCEFLESFDPGNIRTLRADLTTPGEEESERFNFSESGLSIRSWLAKIYAEAQGEG